jgi:foldase protein PrsA
VSSPSRLRSFVALALVPLALALGACSGGGGGAGGGPAASVGDVDISHAQLERDIVAFEFLSSLSGAPCGTPADGESQDAACARLALTNDIQEELVKAYALANDVTVDADAVTEALAGLEQNLGGAAELDRQLEEAGFTREGLEALATRLLLFNAVQQAVLADRLDEDTLRELFEGAKLQYTTVEVSHILLETRREAERIASEATVDNFARLAEQSSTDPGSAASGGSLGSYSEAQFVQQFDPTFVEAALALEPGEISGVVETQFGFHVIELVRRDVAAFEDVRDQLMQQQGAQVFDEWLRERYESVEIDVNPRYGRLDGATGQVEAIRSTDASPGPTGGSGATGATGLTVP